jgi:hypothetical protein
MKQFNECLQSKILHTHHEGLGFHGMQTGATSNSDEWHNQQMKTKFVPATTDTRLSSSSSRIVTKESEKTKDPSDSNDKKQKKQLKVFRISLNHFVIVAIGTDCVIYFLALPLVVLLSICDKLFVFTH